jgi:hypothetical protein
VPCRDVEALKSRLNELEAQFQQKTGSEAQAAAEESAQLPSPPESEDITSPITQRSSEQRRTKNSWLGFWKAGHPGRSSHYYGPTSSQFFVHRFSGYLASHCGQHQLADAINLHYGGGYPGKDTESAEELTRGQEKFLIDMFWQSYHAIFPILHEPDFRQHYNSLWVDVPPETSRRPSALVDSVLALCIQFSTAALASTQSVVGGGYFPANEGRYLYARCRMLLRAEPMVCVSTLQTRLHAVVFLMNASRFHEADELLSLAVSQAYALGLQHDSQLDMPTSVRLLRRRLWWTVVSLDNELSLGLGRPNLVASLGGMSVETLDDGLSASDSGFAGASNPTFDEVSWLSYHIHYVKLMNAARLITSSFTAKCDDLLAAHNTSILQSNSTVLESTATYLRQISASLQGWADDVPKTLQLPRRDNRDSFTAPRCYIDFDLFLPIWLQRQRILLELLYHQILMFLFRTYIRFPLSNASPEPTGSSITASSDGNAVSALHHGIAIVHIIDQALQETELIGSWHSAFTCLWQASITVVAFIHSRPFCPHTVSARKVVPWAIRSLDLFAEHGIGQAATAANTLRELSDTSGKPFGALRSDVSTPSQSQSQSMAQSGCNTPILPRPSTRSSSIGPGSNSQMPIFTAPTTPSRGSTIAPFDPMTSMFPIYNTDGQISVEGMSSAFSEAGTLGTVPLGMDLDNEMLSFDFQHGSAHGMDPHSELGVWNVNMS